MGVRSINQKIKCLQHRRHHIGALIREGVKNSYYNGEYEALELAITLMVNYKNTRDLLMEEMKAERENTIRKD